MDAVVFVGEMVRAVRHRDEPLVISYLPGTFEGYVVSLLVNSAGLGVLITMTIEVSAVVIVVVAWSRTPAAARWPELDFVGQHAPKYGRPAGDD
ncbi:hypothetical protein [Streptomyces sp. NBC_00439]|uniref:hypothetical protein n=1 Tax=unclassified Streptomyces TaxID=2593676 RepID=UPI0022557736|nr:hypothetical protein [Streptomyces sp. NBC_00439]MCX5103578.1 hypothetical protein [Streptomyces sp. NBC_00439]WSX06270.1 hypothetical protein OG355_40815 [Streptomyces sp. NBC_00987]